MTDVNLLYVNSFGIAFEWPTAPSYTTKKIQLVFRDTGLMLSKEELWQFLKNIQHAKRSSSPCADCSAKHSCKALLVDSPFTQVSFAMNVEELKAMNDLVKGTLFHLDLENLLDDILRN